MPSPKNDLPKAEDAEQSGGRQNGSGSRTEAMRSVDATAETVCNELKKPDLASWTPTDADRASRV